MAVWGEKFVAILPGSDIDAACAEAASLRREIMMFDSLPWLADRHITVSIGVAVARMAAYTTRIVATAAWSSVGKLRRENSAYPGRGAEDSATTASVHPWIDRYDELAAVYASAEKAYSAV